MVCNTCHHSKFTTPTQSPAYLPLPLVCQVQFVANEHKGKVLWVFRAGLNEEVISPPVQVLEGLEVGEIKNEDASVRPAVEGYTEALIAFLSSSVPDLLREKERSDAKNSLWLGTDMSVTELH